MDFYKFLVDGKKIIVEDKKPFIGCEFWIENNQLYVYNIELGTCESRLTVVGFNNHIKNLIKEGFAITIK